ncbi:phenylacetate-CoA ligase [Desulfonatronum thiosulfatophilum]|uniref:Phenylacetate-CoA ligase n=1 Tax=Desulfonatronum thiosulfatophilum TaxID=617002 RepID=A0A1G6A833_9BACT|nr:AMP-binding protein [Desulfonatronum thiosulfatophilum]SDB04565.1 phenylacetate-CoA ligase [Desulfonatronum thiosulfatophilum]
MDHTIWNPQAECMGREELEQIQLERLQMTLNLTARNVDLYAKRFRKLGLLPEDVRDMSDLAKVPPTTREDLIQAYPYGLFAVPLRSVVQLRLAASSAEPIVVGYTRQDLRMWTELMCRAMTAAGVGRTDIIQVAFNYSQFPGAFTFNQGAESLGAVLTPAATVSAALQIKMMQDFRSTVLAGTPAFALSLIRSMNENASPDNDLSRLHLRVGMFGPEALQPQVRGVLERGLGLKAYTIYGVSEMIEPALAAECTQQSGMHVAEDHFLVEIIDPDTGASKAPGEEGEVVVTSLSTQGYPLIRFRTGDISRLHLAPCPCGRTSARLSPVHKRSDDAVSVRGIRISPHIVERILNEVAPDVADFRLVVQTVHGLGDQVELVVAQPEGSALTGTVLENLRSRLRRVFGLGLRLRQAPLNRLPLAGLTYKTTFQEKEIPATELPF